MEDLQMWRVEQSEAGADKSNGSHTLTGWIETPQILRALLNFREMKVGGEKIQQRADAQRWRTGVIAQSEAMSSSDYISQGFTLCQRIRTASCTAPAPFSSICKLFDIEHTLYILF